MTEHVVDILSLTVDQLHKMPYRQLVSLKKRSGFRYTCGCNTHCGDDWLIPSEREANSKMRGMAWLIKTTIKQRFPAGDPSPPKPKQQHRLEKKAMRFRRKRHRG